MVGNMKELKKLIIGDWTLVGTVISVDSQEGTSILQTESGNKIKIKGTLVEPGKKAIVKNGVIVSQSPTVAYYEFEV